MNRFIHTVTHFVVGAVFLQRRRRVSTEAVRAVAAVALAVQAESDGSEVKGQRSESNQIHRETDHDVIPLALECVSEIIITISLIESEGDNRLNSCITQTHDHQPHPLVV